MFESLFDIDPEASEADLRDVIERCERLKSTAAAAQARAAAQWSTARRDAEAAAGVAPTRRGRGLAAEIALARRDSPKKGDQHLGLARALVHEMPHTLAALEAGVLSEWRATILVRESACLTADDRRRLDHEMCADPAQLEGLGDKRITAEAKRIAYRLDPHAVVDKAAKAPQDRTVTTRPAADNMVYLTALMPLAQGIACYASLKREADANPNGRSRGQTMSDTVYERLTGRSVAEPVPLTVNVVLSDEALIGTSDDAATVADHGPIPAEVARKLITDAIDEQGWVELRRLYAAPGTGALVALESHARTFSGGLAQFIRLRDQTCRTPFCNAPIRHIDHAEPHRRGGSTDARNGRGCCEQCNYSKEAPGWRVKTYFDPHGRHVAEHITPTGAVYRSTAPPVAGGMRILTRDVHLVMVHKAA
ncbi:HNH endonuclease signature motif containing protein [Mycolicibacterium bacteremicum]|uniref:HNH endonuclease n=1 Tax=Mycolicibacterium bacteremicum TaxID=564198 RepID=A0A1W9YVH3_MYCBA|nr:HNH endonuclease [Mycolicibacterium bacteremicum]MCV7434268.1 HNH endonuclease [Mycolicibacterium bacteremicum]ORA04053.1 HNH endonuclease [Mycolicibacterium bacteremicum]